MRQLRGFLDMFIGTTLSGTENSAIEERTERGSEFCAGLGRANLMPRPGGGMAYAGDLKSSDLKRSCGFDSRPGHQIFLALTCSARDRVARLFFEFDPSRLRRAGV